MCCNETNLTTSTNDSIKYLEMFICSDNVMTVQTFLAVDKAMSCGLVPSLFLVGAPTNIVSMIIFYRQGLRDRMNLCLFCLAFTDLMYTASFLLNCSFCIVGFFRPDQDLWRWNFIIHSMNFLYGFAYSSGCLTMIIAVERCVCVMFPMKAATLISTKTMAVILFLTLFLIQALCGVYAIKQKVDVLKDEVTGQYMYIQVFTDLYLTYGVFSIIENIVLSCISFFNFTCVLSSTVITVIRLNTAQNWRKSISSDMKSQGLLMRMLVAVSCVYILCTAPNVAMALARFTVPEFRVDGSYCNTFACMHLVGCVIFMFNSSINFFVYVTMSSRFRRELKSLFLGTNTVQSQKSSLVSSYR